MTGNFFVEAQVRHRSSNLRWSFLTVYGPANHELSEIFLMELEQRCCQITFPLVVGGDFNLIRKETDKSSGQGNKLLMNMFNSFIERCQLREIKRVGSRYTWTNKQDNQVLSNIDRVFMMTDWECKYHLATLKVLSEWDLTTGL